MCIRDSSYCSIGTSWNGIWLAAISGSMFIVIENDTEMSETDPFYSEESDGMSKRTQLEEYFSQSLEVELLLRLCPDDEDTLYQIVNLLVDTCATNRKLLRIAAVSYTHLFTIPDHAHRRIKAPQRIPVGIKYSAIPMAFDGIRMAPNR